MSAPLSIHCPQCGRGLKIKDKSLLGKKVKCPACAHPFVLALPTPPQEEEVPLELVESEPPVGTAARWVPEPASPDAPPTPIPQFDPTATSETSAAPADTGSAPFIPVPESPSPTASLGYRKRKKKSGLWLTVVMVLAFLGFVGGVAAVIVKNYRPAPPPTPVTPVAQTDAAAATATSSPDGAYSRYDLESNLSLVEEFAPTTGDPIQLYMIPTRVNLLFHLHPARLWSNDPADQVLRVSLTEDVTNWLAATLKRICRRDPQQIEEATIGLFLGARGTEPDVCAVVKLKQPEKLSDLIEEFNGTNLFENATPRIKVTDEYAYLIHDQQTIAICPAFLANDLATWITAPNTEQSPAMLDLLAETDRDRLFTMVCELNDLRIHHSTLFPEPARPVAKKVINWLDGIIEDDDVGTPDIEGLSWSVEPTPYFHSELRVTPVNTSTTLRIADRLKAQLASLPEKMWHDVADRMQPQQLRFRKYVGRFPAMLAAFEQSTVVQTRGTHAALFTVLPRKAGPNLALGSLFTINEAARTDFSEPAPVLAANNQPKIPDTVAERLKLPVDAEFNRTPLEAAMQYLCDEIHVKLAIDGDALKDAGYTRNMPQTMKLGIVPADRVLTEILSNYQEQNKEMVVSVDEQTKTLHLLTKKFAMSRGLPIYPIPLKE